MHHSITLVDLQLDAQNSCLFTYITFIKILYMFRALPCSSSGGLRRNMQPLVSSLSAGDCLVHRLRKNCSSFINAQNSCLFTHNTFIKILYMFRALPCSSSGGLRRDCIYAASGIVTLCRWLSCAPVKKELQFFLNRCTNCSSFLTGAQTVTCRQWRYQRLHIYSYDVDFLKMSRLKLETCRVF